MAFRVIKDAVLLNNLGDLTSGSLTTSTATSTAIATYNPPANATTYISAVFVGRRTDGVNAGDGAVATLTCAYKNIAGVLTQIGSDTVALPYASTSVNTSAASSASASGVISLKIAGVAGTTINWTVQSCLVYVAQ